MRFITQISRILVGALFIFSGLVKLNDPLGFSYKLNDYFAPDVLNLEFLQSVSLELALFIVILEVLLGLALLLGFWRTLTVWLLLLMIVFFTFLTFYSAYFNKVTDCGCFGDAIPLTPWQSFGKDVILTVLIALIFFNRQYLNPLLKARSRYLLMLGGLAACAFLGNHVLSHLPLLDFRPYAEGMSIVEGRKSAEELGLQPTTYRTVYRLRNLNDGDTREVDSETYVEDKWWKKEDWEIIPEETETVVAEKGYEPPIHDFIITLEDEEITEKVLAAPAIFLVVAPKLEKTYPQAYRDLNRFVEEAALAGVPSLGLTASLPQVVAEKQRELESSFAFATMDETALKTIVRANPGILLLQHGVVVRKWHHNDLPDFETVRQSHL